MTDAGGWTEERVELLKKLWGEGLSASQIAAQIGGGVTRNAVIGKVHRLGLSGRAKTNAPQASQQRPRKPLARPLSPSPAPLSIEPNPAPVLEAVETAEAAEAQTEHRDEVVVPLSERVTIMELRESMCRWPMGDPTTPEFRFCGARTITGLPYCTHHARIAYQPAAERRRDRRLAIR